MVSKSELLKKFVNTPFVWDGLQFIIGANQWKRKLYPSVFTSKGSILDFGCSMGNITPIFEKFDYWGVDIDPHLIAAAKKRFFQKNNTRFTCVDIRKEPIAENFFDHVLFACVGHHLSIEEFGGILPSLLASLKQGGELHFFDSISQVKKDSLITKFFIKIDQGKHIRTLEEYERLFSDYRRMIAHREIFESPNRLFVKLPDLLYLRLRKA